MSLESPHVETCDENRTCETHGPYTAHLLRFGDKWRGGECPACLEAVDQEKVKQRAADRKTALIKQLLDGTGIPKRFADATLANYRPTTPHAEKVLDACQRYVDTFEERLNAGSSMILCGKVGTGKTHLASAIAHGVTRRYALQTRFLTVMQAVRTIRGTYNQNASETETQAFDRLANYPLLILDEAGVQLGSNHEYTTLFEIINRRYGDKKPTILISNLGIVDLSAMMGERLIDRLRENGAVLTFTWESYRGKAA